MINEKIRTIQEGIYEHDESPALLKAIGVDVFLGHPAVFEEPHSISLGSTTISARTFVIGTGAHPNLPPIEGLAETGYITYEDIFQLPELPRKMAVVGGGPIGAELAQAFGRLGTEITIVARGLMPKDEPEVSKTMTEVFKSEGIQVLPGRAQAARKQDGKTILTVKLTAGGEQEIECDTLLVAAGRSPNVTGMALEKAGVKNVTEQGIQVDELFQTNQSHIFAVGDCTGGPQFTHWAGIQGGLAASNALMPVNSTVASKNPWCTFTDPEVAHVGMTEEEAFEAFGRDKVTVGHMDMTAVDRAVCEQETAGFCKLVSLGKGKLLGATIISPAAGELIGEVSLAINKGLTIEDVALSVHAYPSVSFCLQQISSNMLQDILSKEYPPDGCLRCCFGPAIAKDPEHKEMGIETD
eukprot:TRINITY_DN84_c0_g1_i5.p1 TRINITY_DN84_c0_g1~~TRINITY_DN84_c0_g1_i5.p1  ORF type:complete len:411 (-),score=126.17 TRINITY_DN84_c0_g1_i5:313-1545(-)